MLTSERGSRSWLIVALLVSSGLYHSTPIVTASWAALIGCLVFYYCNYGVRPEIIKRIGRTELAINKVVCVNVYYLCDAAPPAGSEFQVECMLSSRKAKWTLYLAAFLKFVFDTLQRLTMVGMICCFLGLGWHQYLSTTLWERCFSLFAWGASFLCLFATIEGIGYEVYDQPEDGARVRYALAESTLVIYDLVAERPKRLSENDIARLDGLRGEPVPFKARRRKTA